MSRQKPVDRPPELWEAGCQDDPVRNGFVIPMIARLVAQAGARAIADVGCGTGFIARGVERQLRDYSLRWCLLDYSEDMLAFARSRSLLSREVTFNHFDLNADGQPDSGRQVSDFGYLAYTLLDFALTPKVVENCGALIRPGGTLVILMPDVLEDVIEAAQVDQALLEQYRRGHCSLDKLDKFTHRNVLFEANRVEHVIGLFVEGGFVLTALEMFSPTLRHKHYCLVLRREGQEASAERP